MTARFQSVAVMTKVVTWKDSLSVPTNNNRESANDDAFSRFSVNSGPIISLLKD